MTFSDESTAVKTRVDRVLLWIMIMAMLVAIASSLLAGCAFRAHESSRFAVNAERIERQPWR